VTLVVGRKLGFYLSATAFSTLTWAA
jgi:hypothetical protein